MNKKGRIYIVPKNDLESVEIIAALKKLGYQENEDLFITNQGWGASWDKLEREIIEKVRERITIVEFDGKFEGGYYRPPHSVHYEVSLAEYHQLLQSPSAATGNLTEPTIYAPDGSEVYGIELQGEPLFGAHNIDHHYYQDWQTGRVDDRTKPQSSLEQVLAMEGRRLTVDQMFVAENDKAFVAGMIRYGHSIAMSGQEIRDKIAEIRGREHAILAEQQGITEEMEKQAEEAISHATYTKTGCMVIELPHSKCATVTDRIPMQEYEGGLLIVCADGERDYYGPSDKVAELSASFGGWAGNLNEEFTFWGTSEAVSKERVIEVIDSVSQSGAAAGDVEQEEVEHSR